MTLTMEQLSIILLLVPMVTSSVPLFRPLDCSVIHTYDSNLPSGVYTIYTIGSTSAVQVYCDMDSHGGRWTVFQRRMDGSVNFHRRWDEYKMGFGSATGEYWLGLESLHMLTQSKKQELLVEMEDFEGNQAYARYSSFAISPESDGYRLHVSGFSDGGAGDTLTRHDGQGFITFDRYQHSSQENCARSFLGAFWYWRCYYPNPNGIYLWPTDGPQQDFGVTWFNWKHNHYSLKSISMKIRPVQ